MTIFFIIRKLSPFCIFINFFKNVLFFNPLLYVLYNIFKSFFKNIFLKKQTKKILMKKEGNFFWNEIKNCFWDTIFLILQKKENIRRQFKPKITNNDDTKRKIQTTIVCFSNHFFFFGYKTTNMTYLTYKIYLFWINGKNNEHNLTKIIHLNIIIL